MLVALATYRALPFLSDDDRLLLAPLRQGGVDAESAVWDSPLVDWRRYDAIVIRSCWDYHLRPAEFEGWLEDRERDGVPLWNPATLLRWNMDKHYLADFAERGLRTIPTLWLDRGTPASLQEVAAALDSDDIVVKPTISASASRTWRIRQSDFPEHERNFRLLVNDGDAMVQPFIPEIVRDGEWSFLFFGGRYSHAVRKRAGAGDFRVQHEHGGSATAEAPRPALVAGAERIVEQVPERWLYARVDAAEVDGELLLTELEMLEPSLFLAYHPAAPRRMADAIRHVMGGRRTPAAASPPASDA